MDPDTYRLFSDAMFTKKTLRLNNAYRGVPINASASILELHANDMVVSTNSLQIMCARLQKFSFITLNDVTLVANLNLGEIRSETAIYKDFTPYRRMYVTRKYVRVSPAEPIYMEFTSPKSNPENPSRPIWVKSSMLDISIHGISILENAVMYKLSPLIIYDPLKIKITLVDPVTHTPCQLSLDGEIRNVMGLNEKIVRLGVETKPDRNSENVLTHYVAQLQKDIIQELKDALDKELATLD